MIDIVREIEATRREVGEGQEPSGPVRIVRLRRDYDAPIDDVWDALTNPQRISRWFLPISGDFRLGGRYELEGNAGGEILLCDRPHRLRVTWVYPPTDDTNASLLELSLATTEEGTTRFELEHTAAVPEVMWAQFGPGAVGTGWDGAVLGLSLHLRGASIGDPVAWQLSPEGRAYATRSAEAWGMAHRAAGADAETADRSVAATIQFYAPDPEAVPGPDAGA